MIRSLVSLVSLHARCVTRFVSVCVLFGGLQAPVGAQAFPPALNPVETIEPEFEEYFNGTDVVSIRFGSNIAQYKDTILVQESGFPEPGTAVGRVAVFTRNSSGSWERNGSIDAIDVPSNPSGLHTLGGAMAIHGDVALIAAAERLFVYRRKKSGDWKNVQRLRLKQGWPVTDVELNDKFAFLATSLNGQGVVYAYRIASSGRLEYQQRLDSGVDLDFYAEQMALSDDRLIVGAIGDNDDRGAAYVFERHGHRWVKEQKLTASNGSSGDLFGSAVAIENDWIAIGAPRFLAIGGLGCLGGNNRGAMYVFHRAKGRWQQHQFVPVHQLVGVDGCANPFGHNIVMSNKWIVANAGASATADYVEDVPFIFERVNGEYVPVATTSTIATGLALHLSRNRLVVGQPLVFGCGSQACIGAAHIYDLRELH